MIENTSSALLNLFLWSVVPGFFSNLILSKYYLIKYSPASIPKKGSAKYQNDYFWAYLVVLMGYFMYCVGQTSYQLPPNYYSKIGIQRFRAAEELKPRFRTLVLQLHPDKVPDADPQRFLDIKMMYEILENKDTKYAYEVFGEGTIKSAATSSKKTKNGKAVLRDYYDTAVINWCVYYIGSIVVVLIMSVVARSSGMYWRLCGLILCASVELWTITRPHQTMTYDACMNAIPYLRSMTVNEKLTILRSIIVNCSIVITQLMSHLEPKKKTDKEIMLELCDSLGESAQSLGKMINEQTVEIQSVTKGSEDLKHRFRNSVGKLIVDLQNSK